MDIPLDFASQPGFEEFLAQHAASETPSRPGSLLGLRNAHADAALLAVYLGLANMFPAYPELTGIRPVWEPLIEDKAFLLRFCFKAQSETGYGEGNYHQMPDFLEGHEERAHDTLITSGEALGPELWDIVQHTTLCCREEMFKSRQDVVEEMHEELGGFIASLEQWLLAQATPEASASATRPRM